MQHPSQHPIRPSVSRKNVTRWRRHNQRRWQMEREILDLDARSPFVCECTSGECFHAVMMTTLEFESAHISRLWCAVLPGHVLDGDAATVLVQHPHFWVVELGDLRDARGRMVPMRDAMEELWDAVQEAGEPAHGPAAR
jgi:hypothetical protein